MSFYINNKKIDSKLDEKLRIDNNRGSMAKVYLYKKKAIKIYNDKNIENISREIIEVYKKLKTKRIILPSDVVSGSDGQIRGVISKYIEDIGIDSFMELSKERVSDEVKYLLEDASIIGFENIEMGDFYLENFVFNRGAYFVDAGRFSYGENRVISEALNREMVQNFFLDLLISEVYEKDGQQAELLRREYVSAASKGEDFLEHFMIDMQEDTLEEYVKRKRMIK